MGKNGNGSILAQPFFDNFECLISKRHLKRVRFLIADRNRYPHLRESWGDFIRRVRSWPIHHAEMIYLKRNYSYDSKVFDLFDCSYLVELSLQVFPGNMVGPQLDHMYSLTCLELFSCDFEVDFLRNLQNLKFLTVGMLVINSFLPVMHSLQELYVAKQLRHTSKKVDKFLQTSCPEVKFVMMYVQGYERNIEFCSLPMKCAVAKTYGWLYENFFINCDHVKCFMGSVVLKSYSKWNLPFGLLALNVIPHMETLDYDEVDTAMRFILDNLPFLEFLEIERWYSPNIYPPECPHLAPWIADNKKYLDSHVVKLVTFKGCPKDKNGPVYEKPDFELSQDVRRFMRDDFVLCYRSEWYGTREYRDSF